MIKISHRHIFTQFYFAFIFMLTFSIENSDFLCVGWHGKSLLLVPSFLSIRHVSLQGSPCMFKHKSMYTVVYTSGRYMLFCALPFVLILGIYYRLSQWSCFMIFHRVNESVTAYLTCLLLMNISCFQCFTVTD